MFLNLSKNASLSVSGFNHQHRVHHMDLKHPCPMGRLLLERRSREETLCTYLDTGTVIDTMPHRLHKYEIDEIIRLVDSKDF